MKLISLLISLLIISFSAKAQENPMDFLVQSSISGDYQKYADQLFFRRHDWGGPGVPLGYVASENVVPEWVANTVVQTWSFGTQPIGFNPINGDGGQISSISGTKAIFWATQDGSYDGLQYFVGPKCGGDGWVLFDTAHQINSKWITQIARLAISKTSPDECLPLGAAYTRWMRGLVVYPFLLSGHPSGSVVGDTILTEHYDQELLDESVNMERNWFVKGLGNIRWEAWSKSATPGNDLAERCPIVTLGGYYYPEMSGWHLVDCRYYTNIEPAVPAFSLKQYGWP